MKNYSYLWGVLAILVGVGLIVAGGIIKGKVSEGRSQIAQAQGEVDAIRELTDVTPYTAPVGGIVTDSAQGEINYESARASGYSVLGSWLLALGIVLVALGALWFLFLWKKG